MVEACCPTVGPHKEAMGPADPDPVAFRVREGRRVARDVDPVVEIPRVVTGLVS